MIIYNWFIEIMKENLIIFIIYKVIFVKVLKKGIIL